MKDRPDLIVLSKKAAKISTAPEGYFSKELLALNIQMGILKIYESTPIENLLKADKLKDSNGNMPIKSRNHFLFSREGKWCSLIFSLLDHVGRIGSKEITTAARYEHAEKGFLHCIKDLNNCLVTGYDVKLGLGFCQDVIGYIEHFCKIEGIDIWWYFDVFMNIQESKSIKINEIE